MPHAKRISPKRIAGTSIAIVASLESSYNILCLQWERASN